MRQLVKQVREVDTGAGAATECVVAVLDGRLQAVEAMRLLMGREARSET